MSRGRVEAEATCPYCSCSDWYSFHVQADSLLCYFCDKEFEISVDVSVTITATRPMEHQKARLNMDLTVETKSYAFSASSGFDYIAIYMCNELKQTPMIGSRFYLTKKEVRKLIEYLKQDGYDDSQDFWILDRLCSMELLMEGKEKAEFRFW